MIESPSRMEFSSQMDNSSRVESSRIDSNLRFDFLKQKNILLCQQEITHSYCSCELCVNDVKPFAKTYEVRETSSFQQNINEDEALLFLLKKCTNHRGMLFVPDLIFLQEGTIFYTNQFGRIRMKDKLTNIEAKKFFDDRRTKAKIRNTEKDSYILMYKKGIPQIMNNQSYGKMMYKRKNDPFWQEVSYSYRMPETKDPQGSIKTHIYKRTKSTAQYMIQIMQKVMKEVDSYEQKVGRDQSLRNISLITLDPKYNSIQNQSNIKDNPSIQFPIGQSTSLSDPQLISVVLKNRSKLRMPIVPIKSMIEEIVAYLEVSLKLRMLQLQIQYSEDADGQPYIIGVRKMIVVDVQPHEQCYLHDRFKLLELYQQKQLVQFKKNCDCTDEQTLWNVCIDIVENCLEQRRISLNIASKDYKRPSKQGLKSIFLKFIPNFQTSEMFQNINWKNEIPKFMAEKKEKINKIIQQDQGISILKRFNIHFYRTF